MNSIFDFTKIYAGVVYLNGENYPCSLSFPDGEIVFKLIGAPTEQHSRNKIDFTGYVSTEQGIMNYRAINTIQTHWSSGNFDLSRQEFQADELLVGSLSSEMELELYGQVNICYNHLENIGNFIKLDQDLNGELKFSFKKYFESLQLNDDDWGQLTLENPARYHLSNSSLQYFRLEIDPFFSFIPKASISLKEIQYLSNRLGWFIQLLFDIRQQPIDVVLFEKPQKDNQKGNDAFYYLAPELIRRKMKKSAVPRNPSLKLNQLSELIESCFNHWNKFNANQRKLATLYFNELNSKEYILDDRFKNLCAIIQGLEVLGTSIKVKNIRGDMNAKLRRASAPEFETIMMSYIQIPVLHRLYEIIGHQRDHFQHLSKELNDDLSENSDIFAAVTTLMGIMIRYHLLLATGLQSGNIERIIKGDLIWIKRQLKQLENKITQKYRLS